MQGQDFWPPVGSKHLNHKPVPEHVATQPDARHAATTNPVHQRKKCLYSFVMSVMTSGEMTKGKVKISQTKY